MNDGDRPSLMVLADGLRSIMETNPPSFRNAAEDYLDREMRHLPMSQRLEALDNLMLLFSSDESERRSPEPSPIKDNTPSFEEKAAPSLPKSREGQQAEKEVLLDPGFAQLVSLMLGKKMAASDLSAAELSEKVAQAMNTVFDTLNQIVEMIQVNLLGRKAEQETIRQIIGSQIGSGTADNSLQNYLDQIREAFLVAHKAFRISGIEVVRELLAELDPEKIAASSEGKLKFGPLRKAELFEVYKEKFEICKGWLESGRVLEGFLREFEKASQKLYKR
jgi:hypothetical protein